MLSMEWKLDAEDEWAELGGWPFDKTDPIEAPPEWFGPGRVYLGTLFADPDGSSPLLAFNASIALADANEMLNTSIQRIRRLRDGDRGPDWQELPAGGRMLMLHTFRVEMPPDPFA